MLLSSQWQLGGLKGDRLKRLPEEKPAPRNVLLDLNPLSLMGLLTRVLQSCEAPVMARKIPQSVLCVSPAMLPRQHAQLPVTLSIFRCLAGHLGKPPAR